MAEDVPTKKIISINDFFIWKIQNPLLHTISYIREMVLNCEVNAEQFLHRKVHQSRRADQFIVFLYRRFLFHFNINNGNNKHKKVQNSLMPFSISLYCTPRFFFSLSIIISTFVDWFVIFTRQIMFRSLYVGIMILRKKSRTKPHHIIHTYQIMRFHVSINQSWSIHFPQSYITHV